MRVKAVCPVASGGRGCTVASDGPGGAGDEGRSPEETEAGSRPLAAEGRGEAGGNGRRDWAGSLRLRVAATRTA